MNNLGNWFRPLGITLLRLAVGVIFLYHGSMKISNLAQTAQGFSHMGFPAATAYFIGPLEVVGGSLLILGLFGRLIGLIMAGEMLVAFLKVHLPSGPITHVSGYELPMLLSAASFWIFCFGPGPFSLDRLLFGKGK